MKFLALTLAALVSGVWSTTLTYRSFNGTQFTHALCNDGSYSGYYQRLSSTSNVWVIHLQGGEWCYDKPSCLARTSALISSTGWASTKDVLGLFESTDPRLANANLIYVPYCTSDAYAGSNTYVTDIGFFFNGRQVVKGVFKDLIQTFGMGSNPNTQILFSGCSGGGRGALFNLEFVNKLVMKKIGHNVSRFGGLLDSPLWVDIAPYVDTVVPKMTQAKEMFDLVVRDSNTLSRDCLNAFDPTEQWKCLVGQYALPFVTQIPYFLHAYQYDAKQLNFNTNFGYLTNDTGLLNYAEQFRYLTRQVAIFDTLMPALPGTSALLPACYKHCNTEDAAFSTLRTSGSLTLEEAVVTWFFDGAGIYLMEDCDGFNCGTDCPANYNL